MSPFSTLDVSRNDVNRPEHEILIELLTPSTALLKIHWWRLPLGNPGTPSQAMSAELPPPFLRSLSAATINLLWGETI